MQTNLRPVDFLGNSDEHIKNSHIQNGTVKS
jgi:hypothetical protein